MESAFMMRASVMPAAAEAWSAVCLAVCGAAQLVHFPRLGEGAQQRWSALGMNSHQAACREFGNDQFHVKGISPDSDDLSDFGQGVLAPLRG